MEESESLMKAEAVEINWNTSLPIHASAPFLKALGDSCGWIGGFDEARKLCCVLAYTVLRKPFLRMIRFRSGPIPFVENFGLQDEKIFLNSIVQYLRSTGADMIVPASNNVLFRTYPDGALAAPYGSFVIDLTKPEEELWDNLHSKHRNVVRNATRKGVEIKTGVEHLDRVYEMVRDTLARSSMGFMTHGAFQRQVGALGENVKLFVAEHEGVLQGAAMVPFSQYGAYYVHGGSAAERVTGAMNLLHWEAIRLFRRMGVKRYDFVGSRIDPEKGSKQEGLMAFKQRFGGELVRGCMWKYPFHALKYRLYSMAMRLKQGGDVVDQERHKFVAQ